MSKVLDTVSSQFEEVKIFRIVGFKALLAWHYLVLFSPLLINESETIFSEAFFSRQLILYSALAITYAFIAIFGRRIGNKDGSSAAQVIIIGASIVATIATFATIVTNGTVFMVSTALLGICKAFLMYYALRLYQLTLGVKLYRSFAIDMLWGTMIAFVVCVLQSPFSSVAIVILAAISAIGVSFGWATTRLTVSEPIAPKKEQQKDEIQRQEARANLLRRSLAIFIPTVVFSVIFGFLQGGYVQRGTVLLMATNPLVILGIAICAVVLLVLSLDPRSSNTDSVHRASLLFYVIGIVWLPFMNDQNMVICEMAIMVGFNLFDFGTMILGIGATKDYQSRGPLFVGLGRMFTYLGLAVGLLFGYLVMQFIGDSQIFSFIMGGIAVVLIVSTVLTPFDRFSFTADTPEEIEAFTSNSNDTEEEESQSTALPGRPAKAESEEAIARSPLPVGVGVGASASAHEGLADISAGDSGDKSERRNAPWKRVCGEVAGLYRLSPRETEIFMLVAKGRNAEYIQKQLFISPHTVKTHMANIYQKLGVHSSQELLDLIEAFKEQGKEKDLVEQGNKK